MSENDLGSLLPSRVYGCIKALIDGCLIVVTAPITVPLVLFTALCIKLESPGPALFVQERMGRGNKPVKMYKLRSMRNGDRKRVVEGKSVSVRVDLGGRRIINNKRESKTVSESQAEKK